MNRLRVNSVNRRVWRKMAKGQVILCTPASLKNQGSLNAARSNVYSGETINNCIIITDTQHMQKQAGVVIDYDAVVYVLLEDIGAIDEEARIIAGTITYRVKRHSEDDVQSHAYELPVKKIELVKADETIEFLQED